MGRKVEPEIWTLSRAFRQPLQSAISCFTRATLQGESSFVADRVFQLRLSEQPTPLGRTSALLLRFAHTYRIARRAGVWEVQTVSYAYWLEDRRGNEFALYQWNPSEGSKVTTPHLHVRPLTMLASARLSEDQFPTASRELLRRFGKAHLPTGFVTLPEILRIAVADLGVAPLERNPTKVADRLDAAEDVLRASVAWRSA